MGNADYYKEKNIFFNFFIKNAPSLRGGGVLLFQVAPLGNWN